MGDAMATPTDKANHTSTRRMMFEVLRRYCMLKILTVLQWRDFLVNCAKYALTIRAFGFNANGVSVFHEFSAGFAVQDSFNCAFFGNTAIALGPFFFAIDVDTLVADSATTHNGAGTHIARFANVGNELAEVKRHLRPGLTHTDLAAIPSGLHGYVEPAVIPCLT
jgi:hypothetical protein